MNLVEFVYAAIPALIQFYATKYYNEDLTETLIEFENDFNVPRVQSYDFIVVGAGTAGCVIAARLSEKFNVLLVESGGPPVPATYVPGFYSAFARAPTINYKFETVRQEYAGGANNGIFSISMGKMMGGSGSHNGNAHNRGNPYDFDNWAKLVDDSSWSYENVLQHFKASERFVGSLVEPGTEGNYGYNGPLPVDSDHTPILPYWYEAAQELGFKVGDPNGNQSESFTSIHKSIYKGRKVSTYTEYIQPIQDTRANLTILKYSSVHKILINNQLQAYGVEFERHGLVQRALAKYEVIVSGGPYGSPLLLIKSGIGPKADLEDAGIPIKVAREGVGKNLQDHVGVRIGLIAVNDTTLFPRIHEGNEDSLEHYIETGEGALGMLTGGPQMFLVSNRARADNEPNWPDLFIQVNFLESSFRPSDPEVMNINVGLGRAKSKGGVRLNSTAYRQGIRDDEKLAIVDFQMLAVRSDADVILEGILFALKLIEETSAFQRLNATFTTEPLPACQPFGFRSEAYWRCVIRQVSVGRDHSMGTCTMGKYNDPLAVVDSKLRVIGVKCVCDRCINHANESKCKYQCTCHNGCRERSTRSPEGVYLKL